MMVIAGGIEPFTRRQNSNRCRTISAREQGEFASLERTTLKA